MEEKYTNNFCQSVKKHCREKEHEVSVDLGICALNLQVV